ncbi:hypothetical protein C0995_006562, partial [Termitomyces sp. Mi166
MSRGLDDTEKFTEFFKLDMGKGLGEDVRDHIESGNVVELDMTRRDSLANEVEMNVDVFGTSVE